MQRLSRRQVVISSNQNEDDGFLIDLDLANKTSDDQAFGTPSKTGTKIFMAERATYVGGVLQEPANGEYSSHASAAYGSRPCSSTGRLRI